MKIIYTFFLCFFFLFNFSGQTYFAFPDSNGVWSVEKEKHLIKGDSIYNSITYKKYYTTTDTNLSVGSLQFVGLVRQDKPNKKIFGIAKTYTTEALMYNFNVNVNDTLVVKPIINVFSQTPRRIKISAKDSVLVNGQYRKRFSLVSNVPGGWSYPETWIEGVGSSWGPLSAGLADIPAICPCFPALLCQKINTTTVYVNHAFNSCYKAVCNTGIQEFKNNRTIKIYPNPANEYLVINTPTMLNSVLKVQNYLGQIVMCENLNGLNAHHKINVSGLSKGVYFLELTDINMKMRSTGKLIIE